MAHGGGGRLSQQLVERMFLAQFPSEALRPLHDGALLQLANMRLAFSTDSYVVRPIFFPGGTIGELAVNGTVNDLAMCGARPMYLSAAFIIEEGLPMEDLWRVVVSMQQACREAGVSLVTGDTKVVDRGKGDKLFITTSGVGIVPAGVHISPVRASAGDAVLLSGRIADHGIAIMSVREGLHFESELVSDTAPLNGLVGAMLGASPEIHVLRDPTRGGIASALNEIAAAAHLGIHLREDSIPVAGAVRGACELLGLDPLYVANEGKLLAIVPEHDAEVVLDAMRAHPLGAEAALIGRVVADHPGIVTMETKIGTTRVVDMLSGEQLPRIC
jgi:hydrogenase expression/formation protein HypE